MAMRKNLEREREEREERERRERERREREREREKREREREKREREREDKDREGPAETAIAWALICRAARACLIVARLSDHCVGVLAWLIMVCYRFQNRL